MPRLAASRFGKAPLRAGDAAIATRGQRPPARGAMFYNMDWVDLRRRSALYVDKILRGAKPSELPVERPDKFKLVINLKTAKQLGITIPPEVLYQATRIIR